MTHHNRIYINPEAPHLFVVIYEEVFHLKSLYIAMHLWFEENGWTSHNGKWEEPTGDEYSETLLYDNRTVGNNKLWVWWRMQKPSGNSYYQYFMNVNFMMLGVKHVEVMHEGVKYKAQHGELTVQIKPWIEYDYKDRWAKHPILKHFNTFFQKRVYKEDMLDREDLLLKETYRFQAVMKNFLERKKFIPDSELLWEPHRKFG